MPRNPIPEEQMKEKFIRSAREIIKGEGFRAVSARTVAERAGYSYATIYNYFSDFNVLLAHCLLDFIEECRQEIITKTKSLANGEKKLKTGVMAFVNYFVQYPGIFDLLFLEKITDKNLLEKINQEVNELWNGQFIADYDVILGSVDDNSKMINTINKIHRSMVTGMLTAYLTRREPSEYIDFIANMKDATDFILF